jgi:hypothetical protein
MKGTFTETVKLKNENLVNSMIRPLSISCFFVLNNFSHSEGMVLSAFEGMFCMKIIII